MLYTKRWYSYLLQLLQLVLQFVGGARFTSLPDLGLQTQKKKNTARFRGHDHFEIVKFRGHDICRSWDFIIVQVLGSKHFPAVGAEAARYAELTWCYTPSMNNGIATVEWWERSKVNSTSGYSFTASVNEMFAVTSHREGGMVRACLSWCTLHCCCWGESVLVGRSARWITPCSWQRREASISVTCGRVSSAEGKLGTAEHQWNTSTWSMELCLRSSGQWPPLLRWWMWSWWLLPQQCLQAEHLFPSVEGAGPHYNKGQGTNEEGELWNGGL